MKRCLIIADDFTGANDTGVQLTKRGIQTQVVLKGENIKDSNVSYVLDTESRNHSEEDAYTIIKDNIKGIFDKEFEMVYKKVDSTLRGNIGIELKAVDEDYKPELIIFAPAFPIIGRTTLNGIHYVNGVRIKETEFARDPKKPVLEDNIQRILETSLNESVIHHNVSEVRDSSIDLNKGRIHSFDAENNSDLENIVQAVYATNKKVLWIGSAGLADVIFKMKKPLNPVLAIVGSLSEASRKQVKYCEEKGIHILKLDISNLLKGNKIDEYVESAVNVLKGGKDLIITSSYEIDDYNEAITVGKSLSMKNEDVSTFTQGVLGELGERILEMVKVSGLFVTGGDTAIGFINKTEAQGSLIIEEILTGIPLVKIKGGKFDGIRMISKAGGFGNEDALFYSIGKLKEVR